MNRPLALFCWGLAAATSLLAATTSELAGRRRFRVVTYNVENLFDTCHDNGKDDWEFLPSAERQWNAMKYWRKLGGLARVIAAAGGDEPPSLVALCEVENDSVLRDLTERTLLRRLGYKYLMTRSPDKRGMDVALLYQPGRMRVLEHAAVRIPYTASREKPTRDILHVCGLLPTGDTLDVFVCHLPSRAGGAHLTESYRRRAARLLKSKADSLTRLRKTARLLALGDFNDEHGNASLRIDLGTSLPPNFPHERPRHEELYILSAGRKGPDGIRGTYKYRGVWNQLDQIIVSGALLDNEQAFHTRDEDCQIVSLDFLLEADATYGGVKPKRTYSGPFYRGGFSDHLPLTADFYY